MSAPASIKVITPPPGLPEGWDAADALAAGWTPARAAALVGAAQPVAAAAPRKPAARDSLLALTDGAEHWHDENLTAFVTIAVDGHSQIFAIDSRAFKSWLGWRANEELGFSPAGQTLEDAVRVCEGLALYRGPCYPTWRRTAEHDDGRVIYVDLGCPLWRAVEIRAGGWRIVDRVPREVKFLRSRGMGRLPDPEAGDMIETLREFVNVESDDDFKLLLAWLVAAIRPRGPFPVLVILGEPGSAKSSLVRLCKRLIDPSRPEHRALPKDDRDLFIAASSNAVLAFDNISRMPEWLSDSFCRLATGGGFGTRRLQTDAKEMLFDAMRPVVLNGIGDVTPRSDLASRALQLTLPALANPRPEVEFYAALDAKWALILGALLDAVAAGLRRLPMSPSTRPAACPILRNGAKRARPGLAGSPASF